MCAPGFEGAQLAVPRRAADAAGCAGNLCVFAESVMYETHSVYSRITAGFVCH